MKSVTMIFVSKSAFSQNWNLVHFSSGQYRFVWRLRGNIIRTALCWVVWHNVHSQQHTHMSRSYRSSRLGLSHWDPYAMHRGACLELYYCNMVEWSWWDLSLIWKTNWLPSVLWHCWFGHMTCKIVPDMTYNVFGGTLNLAQSINHFIMVARKCRTYLLWFLVMVQCNTWCYVYGPRQ